jgi:DNA invertase Pin-like site-specific DNA recombinase
MSKLRFAPIIRVSTEQQEDKGESLAVQRKQIKQYVDMTGGVIPDNCWQYVGQEHATPTHERKKLDQLLRDSSKDKFDAVMVVDASRWSRDNKKSKEGLEIFKRNGIRFFAGAMEFDLFDPNHELMIGITSEINEWQAKQQTLKAALSTIERLQQGRPAVGKLPFGRTWSEEKGWGIDPDKKQMIQQIAKRYLKGESLGDMAKEYDRNYSGLLRTLKNKCGDRWEVSYKIKKLNIDTTVQVPVPRLLPEKTIEAIHRKVDKNKTYHGTKKSKYLLSKYIYCAACGYHITTIDQRGKRYYRHPYHKSARKCPHTGYMQANELEVSVLARLKATLGNPKKVREAIKQANPDSKEIKALEKEQTRLTKQVKELEGEQNNIVKAVGKGLLSENEIEEQINAIRERKEAKENRLQFIDSKLSKRPSSERIEKMSKLSAGVLRNATMNPTLEDLPFDQARRIIEKAFDGKDADGNDLGIYVMRKKDGYDIELRGMLEKTLLSFPLDDTTIVDLFELEPQYQDIPKEIAKIRNTIDEYTWSVVNTAMTKWHTRKG